VSLLYREKENLSAQTVLIWNYGPKLPERESNRDHRTPTTLAGFLLLLRGNRSLDSIVKMLI